MFLLRRPTGTRVVAAGAGVAGSGHQDQPFAARRVGIVYEVGDERRPDPSRLGCRSDRYMGKDRRGAARND